jgi:hypothetical protein
MTRKVPSVAFSTLISEDVRHGSGHHSKIADCINTNTETGIKKMLIDDLRKKYNLKHDPWQYKYSINVLREMLVFGEHEMILNKFKRKV